jgi:hypothetical protein
MIDFIVENWGELLIALLAFTKVIVNLIPSEKPTQVWAIFDTIINAIVEDRVTSTKKKS